MVFLGNAVDAFYRYTLYRNKSFFQYSKEFFRQVALNIFLHKYLVYFFSGLYSLNDGSNAKYHFIFFYHIFLLKLFLIKS